METMHNSNAEETRQVSPRKAAQYWRATLERDARADGTFVLAVRTTYIYCRPSCPARRPLRRNVIFFRTREEAEKQGYRAAFVAAQMKRLLGSAGSARVQDSCAIPRRGRATFGACAEAPFECRNTRRAFREVTGLRPRTAEALRVKRFKNLLRAGKNITDALYETGYR